MQYEAVVRDNTFVSHIFEMQQVQMYLSDFSKMWDASQQKRCQLRLR